MRHAGCRLHREHLHHTDPLCTHSALLLGWDSVFRTCIVHSVRLFFWPLLPILGEFLHSAPASCIVLCSLSPWLWVSFAFCILHPASCTSLTAVALGPLLHSAFCICILHRVQCTALGPILQSAFCSLHAASGAKSTTHRNPTRTSPFRTSGFNLRSFFAWTSLRL